MHHLAKSARPGPQGNKTIIGQSLTRRVLSIQTLGPRCAYRMTMRTALVSKLLLQKNFSLSWAATNLLVLLALLASPAASLMVRPFSIMHQHVVAATRAKASGLRAARMGFDDVYRAMIPGKGNPNSDSSVLKWLALPEVFVLLSNKPAAGATICKHLFSPFIFTFKPARHRSFLFGRERKTLFAWHYSFIFRHSAKEGGILRLWLGLYIARIPWQVHALYMLMILNLKIHSCYLMVHHPSGIIYNWRHSLKNMWRILVWKFSVHFTQWEACLYSISVVWLLIVVILSFVDSLHNIFKLQMNDQMSQKYAQ